MKVIEDAERADAIFTKLMGDSVELRKILFKQMPLRLLWKIWTFKEEIWWTMTIKI